MRVINRTRGILLGDKVRTARTFLSRLVGLLGTAAIAGVPSNPTRRDRKVLAVRTFSPRTIPRVRLTTRTASSLPRIIGQGYQTWCIVSQIPWHMCED